MSDVSMQIKSKVLNTLDSDPLVTFHVPSNNIHPMTVSSDQTPPFIRYGPPTVRNFEDSCGRGAEVETTIHCYAMGETNAQNIAAAVEKSLRGMQDVVDYNWVRTQFREDPDEAGVWDGMVTVVVIDRE